MDWLDLLAVQAMLKSLLQLTVQKQQFFSAQLSLWPNSHSRGLVPAHFKTESHVWGAK